MAVTVLRPLERAESDVLRMTGCAAPAAAERLDAELEVVAEMLSRLALAWQEDAVDDLRHAAAALGMRSGTIGLHRLSRVARTVERLCMGSDRTALAANVARLDRLGQATLEQIWCLQDVPS
jgi:hypothetical protein